MISVLFLVEMNRVRIKKNRRFGKRSQTNPMLNLLRTLLGYHPVWDGYQSIGQGMGAAITIANELECWTLSDRGTALYRQGNTNLVIHEFNDTLLVNPYSILLMDNEHNTSTVALRDFLVASSQRIDDYRVENESLFFSGEPTI